MFFIKQHQSPTLEGSEAVGHGVLVLRFTIQRGDHVFRIMKMDRKTDRENADTIGSAPSVALLRCDPWLRA